MDLTLEQLAEIQVPTVYAAAKYDQKASEAPSSVTVITADEIARYGYRTLAEALAAVPGMYSRDDRNFGYTSVRGFGLPGDYNTRILVLVDGHRMNENVSARAFVENGQPVDLDLVDRIEIVRGPGSCLYGSNAFFAVINIVSRRGHSVNGAEATLTGGTHHAGDGRFTFGREYDSGLEVLVSASLTHNGGTDRLYFPEFDSPTTHNGVAVNADGEEARHAFLNMQWGEWTLMAGHVGRTKHIPTAAFGTLFGDSRTRTLDQHSFADLNLVHPLSTNLELSIKAGLDRCTTLGTYIYEDSGVAGGEINVDDFAGTWGTLDAQLRARVRGGHTLILGTSLVGNADRDQANYDTNLPNVYLDDNRNGVEYALFGQGEFRLGGAALLNAGLRFDHYDADRSSVDPRVALILNPQPSTVVKIIAGTAYRAPSPNEQYYSDGGLSQIPNPGLRAEGITTWEAVLEQALGRRARVSLAGYAYTVHDLIHETSTDSNLIQLENRGRAKAIGLELSLEANLPAGARGRVSYARTDARDPDTDTRLVNSPEHLVKCNVQSPPLPGGVVAAVAVQYWSSLRTMQGAETGDALLADLTLTARDLAGRVDLTAGARNLTDRAYWIPGGPELVQDKLPGVGRTLFVTANVHF